MLDRKIEPVSSPIEEFEYLKAKPLGPFENVKASYISAGEQNIIKAEVIFNAGYGYQVKGMQAAAASNLLLEGTSKLSSAQIAEKFESKGAFVETSLQADYASVKLFCLSNHFQELFELLIEVIEEASFPENEWQSFKNNRLQKFHINQQKVSFMVKNNFSEIMFGSSHPYTNKITAAQFEEIKREDLLDFHAQFYKNKGFHLLLSGDVNDQIQSSTRAFLKSLDRNEEDQDFINIIPQPKGKFNFFEKPGAQQSAIRLGMNCIGKEHEDFPALFFANTILGGYFGSRLMTNIREDKGYTYGIGSGLVSYRYAAYWFLSTEVGVEYTKATLKEIEKEIQKLRSEEINEEELSLIKNYLQGTLMRNFDGPFSAMDRFKSILTLDLDYTYYDNLMHEFKNMSSERLLSIFAKYFDFEKMTQIIAGKIDE